MAKDSKFLYDLEKNKLFIIGRFLEFCKYRMYGYREINVTNTRDVFLFL